MILSFLLTRLPFLMRKLIPVFTFLTSFILSSCTTIAEHFPGVYAIDIQQGNIIDQEMIDQLRPNMNKRQVQYILGSPMLIDVFHQKRWDYIYSEQPGGEARLQKRISLYFNEDNLIGVQGDFKPSEIPVIKVSKETSVDVPVRKQDKTIFGEIVNFFSDDDAPAGQTPEQPEPVDQEINSEVVTPDDDEAEIKPEQTTLNPEVTAEEEPSADFNAEEIKESGIDNQDDIRTEDSDDIPESKDPSKTEPDVSPSQEIETPAPSADISNPEESSEPPAKNDESATVIDTQLDDLEKPPVLDNNSSTSP